MPETNLVVREPLTNAFLPGNADSFGQLGRVATEAECRVLIPLAVLEVHDITGPRKGLCCAFSGCETVSNSALEQCFGTCSNTLSLVTICYTFKNISFQNHWDPHSFSVLSRLRLRSKCSKCSKCAKCAKCAEAVRSSQPGDGFDKVAGYRFFFPVNLFWFAPLISCEGQ